jgi:hypothetical protein
MVQGESGFSHFQKGNGISKSNKFRAKNPSRRWDKPPTNLKGKTESKKAAEFNTLVPSLEPGNQVLAIRERCRKSK